jgi:sigma-B regulation protein RsbU (phosphoserine phosphatase)
VGKFISLFYGVLDSQDHRLTYCNAGHNPPWLIRRQGTPVELSADGAVLGQFPHWIYRQSELRMGIGDELLLFTDGLAEADNANEELFGESRLVRVAQEHLGLSARDLMAALLNAASQHCGGQFQDDASIIVVKAAEA